MTTQTVAYAPVDPKLAHPLGRLRGIIRRYVAIEGVLALVLFMAAWFWLAMLLDYGVFKGFAFDWAVEAPKALRVIALVLAVSGVLALIATKLILRLTREFSDSSLALVLERRYPKILGDRLITAVQLADLEKARQYGYSTDMIKKTVDDVRNRIDEVPVHEVFNWKRLWRQAGLFLILTLGFFLASGVAVCAATGTTPRQFYNQFTDVAAILFERNALLNNTPWPRRAYLEVVDFPGDEMRIGRDTPSPRVKVVAYRWVAADSKSAVGWRPLTWADVQKVLGTPAPELPLTALRDARAAVDTGPFLFGSAHPFTAPILPIDLTQAADDPARWPADRVEQVFLQNDEVRGMLTTASPQIEAIAAVFQQLEAKAADPSMSRSLRKLDVPDEVELRYWGQKTRVDMKLRLEGNNEFTGQLTDLKETVRFRTRGADFFTPEKQITLVPPPMFTELKRDEYHPAYLYHKAPFADARDLPDEYKPYQADPRKLKGLKHVLRDQNVSLTGDKSRFDIPQGTEVILSGKTDKEIKEAFIYPKPGKFPGLADEVTDPEPIALAVEGGHEIRIEFTAANKRAITRQTEFEIVLRDTDNVTSKRLVQIVVEEDRPPEVDVQVDVIRRVGTTFLCTPQALIPFTRESKIRDDRGLNRVEYVYSYTEIEPQAVTNERAKFAAWLFAHVPVLPQVNDPLYRVAAYGLVLPAVRPNLATIDDRSPVPGFLESYRKEPRSLDQIKGKLDGPRPSGSDATVVNFTDYKPEGVREEEGFDIQKIAPGLRRPNENELQRTYLLTLTVRAFDTNVEVDRPGTGQSKETFVFKLVSDAELLSEVAKQEANLADQLDDAIRRLVDVENKVRGLAIRIPGLTTPEQYLAEQARANEVNEQMGKARDVASEVNAEYAKILLEFRANRLASRLISDLETKVVNNLGQAVQTLFPQTEEAYGKFQAELNGNRQPPPEFVVDVQARLATLLAKLREIRSAIGQGLDLKKSISELEGIIRGIRGQGEAFKRLQDIQEGQLTRLRLVPPNAPVALTAGQKSTLRIPVAVGTLYDGNFTMKLEPSAGSELKVANTVKMKEDEKEVAIEVTAGFAKGPHSIRITPDNGPAVDVKVIVR